MRNLIILFSAIFMIDRGYCQIETNMDQTNDPFCRMVRSVHGHDVMQFKSRLFKKNIFESDTLSSDARITVRKNGTDIFYLSIIPSEGQRELLFHEGKAWLTDHKERSMTCIGDGIEALSGNGISGYFPFSVFMIDTMISAVRPFWSIVDKNDSITVINLEVSAASQDISDIRVEFHIYNSSMLPCKIIQESSFMQADKLYEEQVFTGYEFPAPDYITIPWYFPSYNRKMPSGHDYDPIPTDTLPVHSIKADSLELFDLTGKPVFLPDSGLIFLDIWYAGCPPCLKSAPVIEELYQKFKDRIHFYSINETDRDTLKIIRFTEKMGVTFPVLLAGKDELGRKAGIHGYPAFILLDGRSGNFLWVFSGYTEDLGEIIHDIFLLYSE